LARRVLDEVSAIAAADGYPLSSATQAQLDHILTDTSSTFGPSMFRDMIAGRSVEVLMSVVLSQRIFAFLILSAPDRHFSH
jgi:ketopantoate reductase